MGVGEDALTRFKVLRGFRSEYPDWVPVDVPWEKVEPLRGSCQRVHGQTLERLNERGGLGVEEMYAHVQAKGDMGRVWELFKAPQAEILAWFGEWLKS